MVGFIGRQLLFQLGHVAGVTPRFRQFQGGQGRRHFRRLLHFTGQVRRHLTGRLQLAGGRGGAKNAGIGARVGRVLGQDLAIDGLGGGGVTGLGRLFRLFHGLVQGRLPVLGQAVDEGADLAFRLGANEAVHGLAIDETVDGGNGLHPHLGREVLVFIHVDLDQPHQPAGLGHQLFDQRPQLLARAAPGGPEIDDYRSPGRRFDHIDRETGGVAFLDQGAAGPSALVLAAVSGSGRAVRVEGEFHGLTAVYEYLGSECLNGRFRPVPQGSVGINPRLASGRPGAATVLRRNDHVSILANWIRAYRVRQGSR